MPLVFLRIQLPLDSLSDRACGSAGTGMRAQSDYVEAVYQYLLSLAAIERVTAGGIRPDFPGRPRP